MIKKYLFLFLFLSSCSFGGNKAQIKHQLNQLWDPPKLKTKADNSVILSVNLNKDGTVKNCTLKEKKCDNITKQECDMLTASAMTAVEKASPFKHLFADQYEEWQELDLVFSPNPECK